jgi:hypothetical protein
MSWQVARGREETTDDGGKVVEAELTAIDADVLLRATVWWGVL